MLIKQKISDSKLSFKENTNTLYIENPKYLILDRKNSLQKNYQSLKNLIQSFINKSQSRIVTSEKVIKLLENLDDLDDVQNVHSNAEFSEDF